MKISADLFHKVIDELTTVSGFLELAETEEDTTKRNKLLQRASAQMRGLAKLLKKHRENGE
jgi:hypothetical protein